MTNNRILANVLSTTSRRGVGIGIDYTGVETKYVILLVP